MGIQNAYLRCFGKPERNSAKVNVLPDKEGFSRFISAQGHYNLIFREKEREPAYLEELYVPHRLVGVMAQNTQKTAAEDHVWSCGNQKI